MNEIRQITLKYISYGIKQNCLSFKPHIEDIKNDSIFFEFGEL